MPAAYPKPTGESVTRHPQQFGWVDLPLDSGLAAPPLPPLRDWSDETLRWWAELWRCGQATQWHPSGKTTVPMALVYEQMQRDPDRLASLSAELRQHEDRHGLTPKAMLQLRWRFAAPEPAPSAPVKPKKAASRRDRVMQLVPPADAS